MQETQVQSLGPEDTLEEEMATHSVFLTEDPMGRGAWWAMGHGSQRVDTTNDTHAHDCYTH